MDAFGRKSIFERLTKLINVLDTCYDPRAKDWALELDEILEELVNTDAIEADQDIDPPEMSDVEADADTLRSAGMGTDEDYGGNRDEDHF